MLVIYLLYIVFHDTRADVPNPYTVYAVPNTALFLFPAADGRTRCNALEGQCGQLPPLT